MMRNGEPLCKRHYVRFIINLNIVSLQHLVLLILLIQRYQLHSALVRRPLNQQLLNVAQLRRLNQQDQLIVSLGDYHCPEVMRILK